MTKSMKRIHKVTIKWMEDTDPDASYLEQAEFADRLMEYRRGKFNFVGIRADAEILIPNTSDYMVLPAIDERTGNVSNTHDCIIQKITSGGLWGIESDSDAAYLKEIEQEQLSELRDQLHAIGFSNRAISAAMRDLRREEN